GKLALDTVGQVLSVVGLLGKTVSAATGPAGVVVGLLGFLAGGIDRKSTRLNSSHVKISYAVFCLKKKKKKETRQETILAERDKTYTYPQQRHPPNKPTQRR